MCGDRLFNKDGRALAFIKFLFFGDQAPGDATAESSPKTVQKKVTVDSTPPKVVSPFCLRVLWCVFAGCFVGLSCFGDGIVCSLV